MTCYHSFSYSLVLNVRALIPWILNLSYFLTKHSKTQNQKPTSTPTLTKIYSKDNHYLPPFASLAIYPSPPSSIPSLSSTFTKRGGGVHLSLARTTIAIGVTKKTAMTGRSPRLRYSTGTNWTMRPGTTATTHWRQQRQCCRYGPRKKGG